MTFSCQKEMAEFIKNFEMKNFEIRNTDYINLKLKIVKRRNNSRSIENEKISRDTELGCSDALTEIKITTLRKRPTGMGNIDKIPIDQNMIKKGE